MNRPGAQQGGDASGGLSPNRPDVPLADPIAEARRLIDAGRAREVTIRVLGGVAVYMQAPAQRPLMPRPLKDIDIVTAPKQGKATAKLLADMNYMGEEMFNALRGSRRQLYHDVTNGRQLDVFVGEFAMCHSVPIAGRLEQHPYTIPVAELLLTKLQIVELNQRDERDIYSICYHNELTENASTGIDAAFIAKLCADDWGLWRTCRGTIERSVADIDAYDLDNASAETILGRLTALWERIEQEPKNGRWKRRSRLGDRKRWYQEPEEV